MPTTAPAAGPNQTPPPPPTQNPAERVDVRLKRAFRAGALPRELLVCGPAGTGKTYAVLAFLHRLALLNSGLRLLFVRQTRVALTESVLVTYEQEILPAAGLESLAGRSSRRHRTGYRYPNGSEIVLAGLDEPSRVASTAWDAVFVNEAIELTEDGWEMICSRLDRPGRRLGLLVGDTNPGDPSHWLKRRCQDGRTVLWDTSHRANPALWDGRGWTAAGAAYLGRLARLTGTRAQRLYHGLWAAGAGQWFAAFDPAAHVSEAAEFDPAYPVHLAVDTGVHTGAVWFQIRGGRSEPEVAVFADYYSYDVPAFENGRALLAVCRERCRGGYDVGRYDPAGNAAAGFGGTTVVSELTRAGLKLNPWLRYPGCVAAGLALVESFVACAPPRLRVHPRCTHLIDAFTNYRRRRRGGQYVDEPEDPQHPYEELMDALRSGLHDHFPEGRRPEPALRRVAAGRVF